jgi:hypothetical protein
LGWNIRYTTDLTKQVWFYLRGEEYSAQLDHFVQAVADRTIDNVNSFASAAMTDRVIGLLLSDSEAGPRENRVTLSAPAPRRRFALFGR